jgi:radical SAM protein with 4Fe4S-binding SPASM domain
MFRQIGLLLNRAKLIAEYIAGRTVLTCRPMHLTLESTNKCNLACPMCNRELDPLPRGNMSFTVFKRIVDETHNTLEFIWPFGEGEPLLNDRIFDMIRYARRSGVRVELSTNATFLDEERSRKLLESGVDNVILAFDGATSQSYERYRKGAKFDDVRARIDRFLELKASEYKKVRVVLQMVLLRRNEHEVEAFRRMWAKPGVDVIRFKEDQLKYDQMRATLYRPRPAKRRAPCYLLWRGPLFVRHDGTVTFCCQYAGRPPIGDLKTQSFHEIWNSKAMQDLRAAHVSGDLRAHEPCLNCTIPRPNWFFTLGSFAISPLLTSRLLPYVERWHLTGRLSAFQDSYGKR